MTGITICYLQNLVATGYVQACASPIVSPRGGYAGSFTSAVVFTFLTPLGELVSYV